MVIKKMIVWFIVVSCVCRSEGAVRNLVIKQDPSSNISDVRCALEEFVTTNARGVKYDSRSGSCEPLLDSWFSNKTFEKFMTYQTLLTKEIPFQPGPEVELEMPPNFDSSNASVVLHIHFGDIESNITIGIHLKNATVSCYHFHIGLGRDKSIVVYVLNEKSKNTFQLLPFAELFPTSFITYRFKIRLIVPEIEFYVNDVLAGKVPTQIPLTDCDTVAFTTDDNSFECKRIEYLY